MFPVDLSSGSLIVFNLRLYLGLFSHNKIEKVSGECKILIEESEAHILMLAGEEDNDLNV